MCLIQGYKFKRALLPVMLKQTEFPRRNPPALLYGWRNCGTGAINFAHYAILSSLNPLRVFELLMNFKCSMWQFPRESESLKGIRYFVFFF